jgi:hypothetical protein
MKTRILIVPVLLGATISLGACADNYAVEGGVAGAAAGAGIAAVTGGDVEEGAAIGAAAGAVGGLLIDKDGKCYRRDRNGDRYRVDCPDRR